MLAQIGGGAETSTSVEKTGNETKVGEWNAYEVLATVDGPMPMKITLWISKDVGIDMSAWSKLASMTQVRSMFGDMVGKLAALDGYPVKQETRMSMMGMEMSSSTEVTLVDSRPVDAAICTVPASFEKSEGMMQMPGRKY